MNAMCTLTDKTGYVVLYALYTMMYRCTACMRRRTSALADHSIVYYGNPEKILLYFSLNGGAVQYCVDICTVSSHWSRAKNVDAVNWNKEYGACVGARESAR